MNFKSVLTVLYPRISVSALFCTLPALSLTRSAVDEWCQFAYNYKHAGAREYD